MRDDDGQGVLELERLVELATTPRVVIGTRVLVREDGHVYISVGNTLPEITTRLGWTQGNVWMPDHVEWRLPIQHPEIESCVEAMAFVLSHPNTANLLLGDAGEPSVRFVISGDELRDAGYLRSRRTRYVDLLVELRRVEREIILRGYHLSPANFGAGRRQIWP